MTEDSGITITETHMLTCYRCNEWADYGRVILCGSYHAFLCCKCMNDWSCFMWQHASFIELAKIEAEERILSHAHCDSVLEASQLQEQAHALAKRKSETRLQLFEIAAEFVKSNTSQLKASPEKGQS